MKTQLLKNISLISNKTKILISISLLMLAFIVFVFRNQSLDSKLCLIAMFFSFLGDVSLNCKPLDKRQHLLLYIGAFFFMVSHIFYATAYYFIISESHKLFINIGSFIAFIIMLLLFCVSLICFYISKKSRNIFMIIVFTIYLIIISINFITICSYSWNFGALSFIGATSFLISDYIIGIETIFKLKSDTLRKLVWIFYPIGQLFIIVCR